MVMKKQPKQERGRERRDRILDAVAAILIAEGERGVAMHAVAASAGASTGSMYHFFQNRDDLLEALFDRHAATFARLSLEEQPMDRQFWRGLSAADAVHRLFGQALTYFSANLDALHLLSRRKDRRFPDFEVRVETALALRLGADVAPAVARTMFAVSTGTLFYLYETRTIDWQAQIASIPSVLTAYLAEQDTTSGLNNRTDASTSKDDLATITLP